MATRKTKPTVVDTPFVETVHSATPDSDESLRARMHAAIDDMLSGPVVSWKRILLAWTFGLAAGFGVSCIMTSLVTYAVVGAALLSGSLFITNLIYIVGLILTAYASYRVSVFVHLKIIDESVDNMFANASNKVRGWFGSSAIKPVAS